MAEQGFVESFTMEEEKLQQEFYESHHGKEILKCIQCGTCSGSCPLTDQMDHAPRELFSLIRDGFMADALCSNTPWFCVSCYQCMVRCPREIPVTDLMYALKQMAVSHDLALSSNKMPDLYEAFSREVKRAGKMNETGLMARYGLKHPLDMPAKTGLALRLYRRGRLAIKSDKTRNPDQIRRMMETQPEGMEK
ncbi:MAG: heterodisulfide reductase [Desulfobacteraceae bacterium]|nr:heterodisulfide reductase [Desulfobacteraceae bacterium]